MYHIHMIYIYNNNNNKNNNIIYILDTYWHACSLLKSMPKLPLPHIPVARRARRGATTAGLKNCQRSAAAPGP